MCQDCDYDRMLEHGGVGLTPNRLAVFETIGNSQRPLTADEIIREVEQRIKVNRVTVYRILDLLVENKLVERLSAGDRSFRYGLAPSSKHARHPHFFCTQCGRMECLSPDAIHLNLNTLDGELNGSVETIQIRLDGTCKKCLQNMKKK